MLVILSICKRVCKNLWTFKKKNYAVIWLHRFYLSSLLHNARCLSIKSLTYLISFFSKLRLWMDLKFWASSLEKQRRTWEICLLMLKMSRRHEVCYLIRKILPIFICVMDHFQNIILLTQVIRVTSMLSYLMKLMPSARWSSVTFTYVTICILLFSFACSFHVIPYFSNTTWCQIKTWISTIISLAH